MAAYSRTRIVVGTLALVSVALMVRAGTPGVGLLLFGAWLVLPFVVTFFTMAGSASAADRIGALATSLLATAGYVSLAFPVGRGSSTAGLGFAFFPLWHFVALGAALLVASAVDSRGSRGRRRRV